MSVHDCPACTCKDPEVEALAEAMDLTYEKAETLIKFFAAKVPEAPKA